MKGTEGAAVVQPKIKLEGMCSDLVAQRIGGRSDGDRIITDPNPLKRLGSPGGRQYRILCGLYSGAGAVPKTFLSAARQLVQELFARQFQNRPICNVTRELNPDS